MSHGWSQDSEFFLSVYAIAIKILPKSGNIKNCFKSRCLKNPQVINFRWINTQYMELLVIIALLNALCNEIRNLPFDHMFMDSVKFLGLFLHLRLCLRVGFSLWFCFSIVFVFMNWVCFFIRFMFYIWVESLVLFLHCVHELGGLFGFVSSLCSCLWTGFSLWVCFFIALMFMNRV